MTGLFPDLAPRQTMGSPTAIGGAARISGIDPLSELVLVRSARQLVLEAGMAAVVTIVRSEAPLGMSPIPPMLALP